MNTAPRRLKELYALADHLFEKKRSVDIMHQDLAENFYPERADFTIVRNTGDELAQSVTTSYPFLLRRELADSLGAMLRPKAKQWFRLGLKYDLEADHEGYKWIEWAEKVQRRAMYDTASQFIRATKEGDNDFTTFGQCVISVEVNKNGDGLLYRCWHLRDMAWQESSEGKIDFIARRWKPTVHQLVQLWGKDNLHSKVKELLSKNKQFEKVNCKHLIVPIEMYEPPPGKDKPNTDYVSIHYDCDNDYVFEEVGLNYTYYCIPRWQTVAGSQYAYSPCTVAGLGDARLLQQMSLVLLEAGERASNPPMVAVENMIKSNIDLYPGGVTWVDAEYDERLGEVLRPISQDKSGIPLGVDLMDRVQGALAQAFYINKLNLPPATTGDMTAYEVGQRVQEYIRGALPLFEPMEQDYNGQLCEMTFGLLLNNGAFGNLKKLPESLRGKELEFKFESPLTDAVEKEKGQIFLQLGQMLATTIEVDPSTRHIVDFRAAFRDTLDGIGVPHKWTNSEDDVIEAVEVEQQMAEMQQAIAQIGEGAQAAEAAGNAVKSFSEAENIS